MLKKQRYNKSKPENKARIVYRDFRIETIEQTYSLSLLRGLPAVALDVEHSGMPYGHQHYRLKTIQLGWTDWAIVLDAADVDQVALAVQVVNEAHTVIAHAAQSDLHALAHHAETTPDGWFAKTLDTMVLAALVDPKLRPHQAGNSLLGLKPLSAHMLTDPATKQADIDRKRMFAENNWLTNVTPNTPPERNGWLQADIYSEVMLRYAAADIFDAAALATLFLQLIEV